MANITKLLEKLLEKYIPKFLKAMGIDYGVGSSFTITTAKGQGKQTNMNPLNLSKKDQQANINIISDLVKGVNDDMSKKINYLTNKSVTEGWSSKQLAQELKSIFDKDSPNYFNYKNRFDTIAKTESTRLMNVGANNTAKRLGAKKKYLFNPIDNKTSRDSRVSQAKYGNETQAIPIDKPFKYIYGGKQYVFMLPPDRVNDRSIVVYTYDEE